MLKKLYTLFLILYSAFGYAQVTVITGKVIDAKTNEPMPFVNVVFKGTIISAQTNFDGNYTLQSYEATDSVFVAYLGYFTVVKPVIIGDTQIINFALSESTTLEEFVVKSGTNPADLIIKKAQKTRATNDYARLNSFQYESFNKIQIAVDNFSDKFKERKVIQQMIPIMDTISSLSDTKTPILPIFISETLSDFIVQNRPLRTKETIKATKISGVGVTDGSLTSQLLGSTFQQYNFNDNWLDILDKKFASPIGSAGLSYYNFELTDTVIIEGFTCFGIVVHKKRQSDLGFEGKIWITDNAFAIKRVDLFLDEETNLNFIERLKIQQETEPSEEGAWMPRKTRVLINIKDISENTPGMIALFYVSNKNFILNKDYPPKTFEQPIEVLANAQDYTDDFWDTTRHEELTEEEIKIYRMVDTLKNLPIVKTYLDYIEFIFNGYYHLGPIDIGPYATTYGFNNLEGHRFRIGLKTGETFSKRLVLGGHVAYGTFDERFKYGGKIDYIISRKKWTVLGLKYKDDVEQIGVNDQDYNTSNLFTQFNVFQSNYLNRALEYTGFFTSELKKGITQTITATYKEYTFQPINTFNFAFYDFQNEMDSNMGIRNNFTNGLLKYEVRFAMREAHIVNGNERISLGNKGAPVFVIGYTRGLKGFLNSEFNYNKLDFRMSQYLNFGRWGTGDYIFTAGKIFERLPYALLQVQRGNQSFISSRNSYNLMNFFEFVTDQYLAFNYEHHFEGLLTNRLPFIKRYKLRIFGNIKTVWGSISKENLALVPPTDALGRKTSSFSELNREPYVEMGYGVENILRFIRVDVIHRMTHRDNPNAQNFGVKLTFQFTF